MGTFFLPTIIFNDLYYTVWFVLLFTIFWRQKLTLDLDFMLTFPVVFASSCNMCWVGKWSHIRSKWLKEGFFYFYLEKNRISLSLLFVESPDIVWSLYFPLSGVDRSERGHWQCCGTMPNNLTGKLNLTFVCSQVHQSGSGWSPVVRITIGVLVMW